MTHPSLLDVYGTMEPLTGDSLTMGFGTAHVFVVNLIVGNDNAEAKIQIIMNHKNGSMYWSTMKYHY